MDRLQLSRSVELAERVMAQPVGQLIARERSEKGFSISPLDHGRRWHVLAESIEELGRMRREDDLRSIRRVACVLGDDG